MLLDMFGRPLRNLRLSVTDRCNLRCEYCMPEETYTWLPRHDLPHFGEMCAIVDVFIALGVDALRITGGEPLLRRELPRFVQMLAARAGLRDIAMTTNGILLAEHAAALKAAGLQRVTVSLDTLRPERFRALTRAEGLDRVHAGIDAAHRVFGRLKLDVVVIRGVNDDELVDLVEYGRAREAEVRFIEFMDVGGATRWSPERVVSRREMLATIAARYGRPMAVEEHSSAPADRFALPDGTVFGIISSTTAPFCSDCNRSRLTADGRWYTCLYATGGIDLGGPFRGGASSDELKALVEGAWTRRTDRGAEQRLALGDRRACVPVSELRRNLHLEMHTRGG